MIHSNPRPTAPLNPWLATAALSAALLLVAPTSDVLTQAMPTASADDSLYVTPGGRVGIGTNNPARQLHMVGDNAVVRMDRTKDAATFMMVRTDPAGEEVWKAFSVGTRASGPDDGVFVIQDFGTTTGGGSRRRLTITNDGEAHFTGTVRAPDFVSTSSQRYKDRIETITDASQAIRELRGVRFAWKDSGQPALGLVAEEVQQVYPELVHTDHGKPAAVNYQALVAVLVQAAKEQRTLIDRQARQIAAQQDRIHTLEERQDQLDILKARMEHLEGQILTGPATVRTTLSEADTIK